MEHPQRQIPTRTLLKRFIPYFYKYKWLLLSDLMAACLTTVCELVLPLIVRRVTNGALGTAEALSVGEALGIEANDGLFIGQLTVMVSDTSKLNALIKKLKTVKGVKNVSRL